MRQIKLTESRLKILAYHISHKYSESPLIQFAIIIFEFNGQHTPAPAAMEVFLFLFDSKNRLDAARHTWLKCAFCYQKQKSPASAGDFWEYITSQ